MPSRHCAICGRFLGSLQLRYCSDFCRIKWFSTDEFKLANSLRMKQSGFLREWNQKNKNVIIERCRKLGRRTGGKNIVTWQKANPDLRESGRNLAKRVGRKTLLTWMKKNPSLHKENARRVGVSFGTESLRKYNEEHPELKSEAGRLGGIATVRSGKIFNNMHGTVVYHQDHFHRSNPEPAFCMELQSLYDKGLLHSTVCIGGIEVDFVLGSNRNDPSTWQKVIEYHPIRTWEGETLESYKDKRVKQLRQLGVTCPVEVVR